MNESEQTPIAESRDLSPSEAALLAQTARLSPEERFNVLLSLWSFWHEMGGTASIEEAYEPRSDQEPPEGSTVLPSVRGPEIRAS